MFSNIKLGSLNLNDIANSALDKAVQGAQSIRDATPGISLSTKTCCVGLCPKKYVVTCVLCDRKFCKEHCHNPITLTKGIERKPDEKYCVPEELKKNSNTKSEAKTGLGSTFINMASASAAHVESTYNVICGNGDYVCCWPAEGDHDDGKTCKDRIVEHFIEEYERHSRREMRIEELKIYLDASSIDEMKSLFEHKKPSIKDDTSRERMILAGYKTAEFALSVASPGVAILGQMVLYGVQAKFLMKMLQESFGVDEDMIALMFSLKKPLIHGLRNFSSYCAPEVADQLQNLTYKDIASDIVPAVFYLSRQHIYDEIIEAHGDSWRLADDIDAGTEVTVDMFRYILPFIGPAAWLYNCTLPGVHNTPEWDKWYMQQVLSKDGWTVVGAICRTSHVPRFEYEFMADDENIKHNVMIDRNWICPAFCLAINDKKEAILAIRGSASALDWTINLNNIPEDIVYFKGLQGDGDIIEGKAHGGIYRGAEGILRHCHLYEAIENLVANGYDVKVTGHSLGAGTAIVIAVLLKKYFTLKKREGKVQSVPFIPAVGFGVPPVIDEVTSAALLEDGLVISVVNNYDIVSRLGETNILPLAEEVFLFKDVAAAQLSEDIEAFKDYGKSFGAASRMAEDNSKYGVNASGATTGETSDTVNTQDPDPVVPGVELYGEEDFADIGCTPRVGAVEKPVKLVVPGRIIFISKGNDGKNRAIICDHNFRTLNCIKLMESCVEDHGMSSYMSAFADVANYAKTEHSDFKLPAVQLAFVNNKYIPCGVCNEDVVWPYLTKSIACRASATSTCCLCGNVVCNVCAPAGEKIPGDGYGKDITLTDRRTPLPSQGLYKLQRLCLPCYFKYHEYY